MLHYKTQTIVFEGERSRKGSLESKFVQLQQPVKNAKPGVTTAKRVVEQGQGQRLSSSVPTGLPQICLYL